MFVFYNKSIFAKNLVHVNNIFKTNSYTQSPMIIYGDSYIINHENKNKMNSIRIWKNKFLFNYPISYNTFVGALDYKINDDHVKIEFLNLNDNESSIKEGSKLSDIEANDLKYTFLNFIKTIAKDENKDKIIVDVHSNLRIYNLDYKNFGFVVTDRKCKDNPYWLEAETSL